jgi:glycerol-3-phosphate dehydrogenase
MARKINIDVPITEQVHAILHLRKDPKEAVQALMTRDPKTERE